MTEDNAVAHLRRIEDARATAYFTAMGTAGDHPEYPSVIAAVQQERVAFLQIDQSIIDGFKEEARPRPGDDTAAALHRHQVALLGFNSLVNGVVHAAQQSWRDDYARLLSIGVGVDPSRMGSENGGVTGEGN